MLWTMLLSGMFTVPPPTHYIPLGIVYSGSIYSFSRGLSALAVEYSSSRVLETFAVSIYRPREMANVVVTASIVVLMVGCMGVWALPANGKYPRYS